MVVLVSAVSLKRRARYSVKVLAPVQIRYITQKEAVAQSGRAAGRKSPRVSGSNPFPSTNGAVAEVVAKAYSAWSEKPETPVRARSVPQIW